MKKNEFGQFLKALRIRRGITLRQFCLKHKLDAGNMSKIERGLFPPPQSRDKLLMLAKAVRIKQGSEDWCKFFDLAARGMGNIPRDISSDRELASKLPILFRTVRSEKISKKKLNELIQKIKTS